jgi:cytochrome P450 family 4
MITDTPTIKITISLSTGQRFAVLEEKTILSSVLRKYKLESVDRRENIDVMFELILRPKHGLKIEITPR